MKLGALARNVVHALQPRWARVVVVEMPRHDGPVLARRAANVDHAGWTEIRPRHLFFAGPVDLHRFSRGLGQSRGFDSRFAGMLAAVARASVQSDDAYAILRQVESLREFIANTERTLATGPDGQLAILPLGDRAARLQWNVRDVGDRVRSFSFRVRRRDGVLNCRRLSSGTRLEQGEKFPRARLRVAFPFGLHCFYRGRQLLRIFGSDADELAIMHHRDTGHFFSRLGIDRNELRTERRRPDNFAVE